LNPAHLIARTVDLPLAGVRTLARRYAQAVQRRTTAAALPLWAKQMEIFILEDLDEIEAAKIMFGGLLASGLVRDSSELRFLQARLQSSQ